MYRPLTTTARRARPLLGFIEENSAYGVERRYLLGCFSSRRPLHAPLLPSQDKVAMDLGFYYMANAMGRLVGVLVGGFLYHYTVSLRTIASVFWPGQASPVDEV